MARRILIVDDSETGRMVLREMLCDDYVVETAESGKEAISLLLNKAPSISAILLDIIMPGMDGFEVLDRIRNNAVWSQIPVIVCTALSDTETQDRAIELGAYGVLIKPYSYSLLNNTLRNCIRFRETAAIVNNLRRDKLTGLYNRESFMAEAERLIKIHEPGYYALSCFDVENFKIINDQYGTLRGDAVLMHIAACIKECGVRVDGICCRIIADNFAILYPYNQKSIEIIRSAYEKALMTNCIDHEIKIRVGRYIVRDLSLSVNSMYDRAMMAQQSIKGLYNVYIKEFDDEMQDNMVNERHVITVMYDALNDGEFVPWFQPQYNHETGAIVGAEALVRWKKPDGKMIYPNIFIPIFERNGFIYEVDKYMWDQAAKTIRGWLDTGRHAMPISVNISRYDIFRDDFFDYVTGLIPKYDIPVDLLRLEITESAFSKSPDQIDTTVERLVEFGFTVEIDDFGSGYSSLNTLKDVPAQILKLDRSFMFESEKSERGGSIVESVVNMAHKINMEVIAEGVEEKAQADYLASIGCTLIQGYYYAKPMPLADYEALLEENESKMLLELTKE